ncbi:MAG: response regulator [Candidatus Kapaibacterium sp.]
MATTSDKKIMVVDDEEDVRNYLRTALEDAGFTVTTASDGNEALEKIKHDRPDLISLDLVMPKHSGIKFYNEIQKSKEFKNIPVLIVTGHAHDELGRVDFEELMMSGPGVYLEKPVKPANYVEKICGLLDIPMPENMQRGPEDAESLRTQLQKSIGNADPEALQRALDALGKKK